MRIISVGTLRDFWLKPGRGDAEQPLRAWIHIVRAAEWQRPTDIKAQFNSADVLGHGRVIFDIGGNKYRIVAAIHYRGKRVYVRFVGTHAAYDKINVETV